MKKTIIGIIVLILFIIMFIPQILSFTFGTDIVATVLQKKFNAKTTVGAVHFSWPGPQIIEQVAISNDQMSGTIGTIQIDATLWDLKESTAYQMKNCNLTFGTVTVGPFDANIKNSQIDAEGNSSQGGHFSVKGKYVSENDFDIAVNCSKMPSGIVDTLMNSNGYFAAAIGATFDLVSKITSKEFQADLTSPNAKASVKSEINQNVLNLTSPANATLQFSSSLSEKINGVIVEAKNPITLQVDAATTDLKSFALESANGVLDLGQLVFADIHPLLSLLTLLHRGEIVSKNAPIWFTKANLTVDHDILSIGRVDALIANAVHLSGWGDINLKTNKLNMVFGIPADTLTSSLGIQNLPKDFVLQVPVTGTIDNPKFDTRSAAAKIAILIGSQQVTKKAGPLQGLIQKTATPVKEKTAPPPNKPFPWEKKS